MPWRTTSKSTRRSRTRWTWIFRSKEQKKIAAILSTVDEKIDVIDTRIEETETLKKGLMQKLLTEGIEHTEFKDSEIGKIPKDWNIQELNSLCTIKHGYAFKSSKFVPDETEYVVLTPGNVKIGGGFNHKYFRFYADNEFPSQYALTPNDFIVSMTDLTPSANTLGYPFLIPDIEDKTFLHNQRLGKIDITQERLDKQFLYYCLCSERYRKNIVAGATGTTVKHTSPKKILAEYIPIPDLKEQQQISNILSTTDEKIETLRAKKESFEILKQGLMQKLLTGEVRV